MLTGASSKKEKRKKFNWSVNAEKRSYKTNILITQDQGRLCFVGALHVCRKKRSFFIPADGRSNINLPSDRMLGVKISSQRRLPSPGWMEATQTEPRLKQSRECVEFTLVLLRL